jgi:hypothetical protein
MPIYTISDAIKFTGEPTKTRGKPIKTIGDAIKFTGMPTKTIGKLIKTRGEPIKFYYFLMRPDSISKTASCVSE